MTQQSPSIAGQWELAYFHVLNNDQALEEGTKMPVITIDSTLKKVTGNGGCNRMFATLNVKNDALSFSRIGSTKMMCDVLNVETEFLQKLEQVTHFEQTADQLLLKNKDGLIMTLKRSHYDE